MGTCCTRLREEFRLERLHYDHFDEGEWLIVFGSSSNRCLQKRCAFDTFRLLEALLLSFILVWSLYKNWGNGCLHTWLIFLTHWSLMLQLAYAWLAFWTTLQDDLMVSGKVPKQDEMPWYVKAMWFLQDICIPTTFLVFVLYFVLVAPTKEKPLPSLAYFTHGVNFVVMITDIYVSRQPYYLVHGIYFGMFAFAYLSFTYLFNAAGGKDCYGDPYIYSALKWNEPTSTGTLAFFLLFIVAPFVNFVFWFLVSQCFPWNYQEFSSDESGETSEDDNEDDE